MRYGSVCSGIEAATVAWHSLGWQPAFFSEIDKFPRAVLEHHYPDVPLHGDFTTIGAEEYGSIELLVGGTPCQSFSVAGLRGGLDDDRGNLALEFLRLAQRTRPRWLVWENVPGVLSSNGGRDFGSILGGLVELGYGFAYRVLDAQYFGVAQRRRRVFVVGYLGDWRPAAAVLFERQSLRGDSPPSRSKGQDIAGFTATSFGKYREGCGTLRAEGGDIGPGSETIAVHCPDVANPLTARMAKGINTTLDEGQTPIAVHGTQDPDAVAFMENQRGEVRVDDVSAALGQGGGKPGQGYPAVAFKANHYTRGKDGAPSDITPPLSADADKGDQDSLVFQPRYVRNGRGAPDDVAGPLTAQAGKTGKGDSAQCVASEMRVRRLTPRECERLQGFPDDYTAIPWCGKDADHCPDGPRYKALGNSMAVPVMRWIGGRIDQVEECLSVNVLAEMEFGPK